MGGREGGEGWREGGREGGREGRKGAGRGGRGERERVCVCVCVCVCECHKAFPPACGFLVSHSLPMAAHGKASKKQTQGCLGRWWRGTMVGMVTGLCDAVQDNVLLPPTRCLLQTQ